MVEYRSSAMTIAQPHHQMAVVHEIDVPRASAVRTAAL
jgi:hypothetical protein